MVKVVMLYVILTGAPVKVKEEDALIDAYKVSAIAMETLEKCNKAGEKVEKEMDVLWFCHEIEVETQAYF